MRNTPSRSKNRALPKLQKGTGAAQHGSLNPVEVMVDYYTVLGLPRAPTSLQKSDLKLAYHRALLKHHADKSGNTTPSKNPPEQTGQTFTIDEITTACKTLLDPAARAEYDRVLRINGRVARQNGYREEDVSFQMGLETFDLDDMEVEVVGNNGGEQSIWYRGCRCGDDKGFLVHEDDLEREIERGRLWLDVGDAAFG